MLDETEPLRCTAKCSIVRVGHANIGSKSLDQCKKLVVKSYDLILLTESEWLKRNFSYLSIILPLDFSELLTIFEITGHFISQLI